MEITGFMRKIEFCQTAQNLHILVTITVTKQSITIQIKMLASFLKHSLNSWKTKVIIWGKRLYHYWKQKGVKLLCLGEERWKLVVYGNKAGGHHQQKPQDKQLRLCIKSRCRCWWLWLIVCDCFLCTSISGLSYYLFSFRISLQSYNLLPQSTDYTTIIFFYHCKCISAEDT